MSIKFLALLFSLLRKSPESLVKSDRAWKSWNVFFQLQTCLARIWGTCGALSAFFDVDLRSALGKPLVRFISEPASLMFFSELEPLYRWVFSLAGPLISSTQIIHRHEHKYIDKVGRFQEKRINLSWPTGQRRTRKLKKNIFNFYFRFCWKIYLLNNKKQFFKLCWDSAFLSFAIFSIEFVDRSWRKIRELPSFFFSAYLLARTYSERDVFGRFRCSSFHRFPVY